MNTRDMIVSHGDNKAFVSVKDSELGAFVDALRYAGDSGIILSVESATTANSIGVEEVKVEDLGDYFE